MRHTMVMALTEHAALIDADIKKAVDAYCQPDNIAAVVKQAATQAIDAALKEEVRSFFSWNGDGRAAVRAAVQESLLRQYPVED